MRLIQKKVSALSWLTLTLSATVLFNSCTRDNKDESAGKDGASSPPAAEAVPVRVQSVKSQPFSEMGRFIGVLSPSQDAQLISHAGGRVLGVHASEGQKIRAGVPLCDIEAEKFRLARQAAQIQSQLQKDQLERSKLHLEQQSIAKTQLDRSQLEALNAERSFLEADDIYRGAACISPINGTVIYRYIDPFDQLQPNSPTLHIADISSMKLTVGIPENLISGYRIQAPATLQIDSLGTRNIPGKISSISGRVDQNTKTFRMEIEFSNAEGLLKSGMTGTVSILRNELESAIVIPVSALFNLQDGYAVFIVAEGIARRKNVTVGPMNGEHAVITQGLQVGDLLIIERSPSLTDGTAVTVLETL